ncbi:MAG: hypothetical protein PUA90_00535 [bacterium]|nr:hypothetical protein [bacterium]
MKIVLLDEKNKDDRKYIKDCNLTDVARVYGGKINASNFVNLNGYYLKSSSIKKPGYVAYYINSNSGLPQKIGYNTLNKTNYGIRPVIEDIDNFDEITKDKYLNEDYEYEVEYGLYPKNVIYPKETLERLKNEGQLNVVGNNSFSDVFLYKDKYFVQSYISATGDIVWFELKPVKWIVDNDNKRLISKEIIMSGVKFHDSIDEPIDSFESTIMYRYLNEVMLKDLMVSINKSEKKSEEGHIYNLNYENLSENDVIRNLILCGIPVSLIGDADKEKEDILRSIDSNYVLLRTDDIYDLLNEFKNKCIKEPDRMHILNVYHRDIDFKNQYLQIIINYMENIKNYTMVSTKDVDVDFMLRGIDSFKFKVKPYIPKMIKILIKEDVHSLIYTLILYLGEDRINSMTTHKKLIRASKILKTNGNVKLLNYILGEELTNILKCLVQEKIITIDDVINRNYSSDIFEMNNEKKALLIPYLAQVDEENIEVVRNFVISLDSSLLNTFDYLWCKEDLERKKIIEDLGKTNNMILKK